MKGLGNYRFSRARPAPQVTTMERKPGVFLALRGEQALVQMRDGRAYAIPAAPLTAKVQPGGAFIMVVTREGSRVASVAFEPVAEARPARQTQAVPKIQVRSGRKLTTREPEPS
jgi:hypothetical protein